MKPSKKKHLKRLRRTMIILKWFKDNSLFATAVRRDNEPTISANLKNLIKKDKA